jgi:hypothetical protein
MDTAQTSATSSSTKPDNPFPVYSVQPLSELPDILLDTVETPEVTIVQHAVKEFAKTFEKKDQVAPRHLVLAVIR